MFYNEITFLFLSPSVADQLVSKEVTENELLLDKLSKKLDRERRHIQCWNHLAFVLGIPAGERGTFDRYTEHSPTEDMFNYLADVWKPDLKVEELKTKLKDIYRNDVVKSLNEGMQTSAVLLLLPVMRHLCGSLLLRIVCCFDGSWSSMPLEFSSGGQKQTGFPTETDNKQNVSYTNHGDQFDNK